MLNHNNHFHVQGARPTAVFRVMLWLVLVMVGFGLAGRFFGHRFCWLGFGWAEIESRPRLGRKSMYGWAKLDDQSGPGRSIELMRQRRGRTVTLALWFRPPTTAGKQATETFSYSAANARRPDLEQPLNVAS